MSEMCCRLHQLLARLPQWGFPFDADRIPLNGIYVLFEEGEFAHQGDRIVRIGTHAGNSQLPSRLKQHFSQENKDRSIFRKNIGRALLNRDGDSFLEQWEIDLTSAEARKMYANRIDQHKLKETEKRVTEYIQHHFRFIAFRVDDKTRRHDWESKLISTVSLCGECRPSKQWLGHHSPKAKIRESGLWLVNELYKEPLSENDYAALSVAILGR